MIILLIFQWFDILWILIVMQIVMHDKDGLRVNLISFQSSSLPLITWSVVFHHFHNELKYLCTSYMT